MAIPHLRIPFRITSSGAADVVEQDSIDDVAQCVEVLLRTRPGDRPEVPEYGIDEPLFGEGVLKQGLCKVDLLRSQRRERTFGLAGACP